MWASCWGDGGTSWSGQRGGGGVEGWERGTGGVGAEGGKAARAAEVSHQHTDIWMKQTAPLIRGRRRSCPTHTGLGHKQVITRPDPPPQQGSSVFNTYVCTFSQNVNRQKLFPAVLFLITIQQQLGNGIFVCFAEEEQISQKFHIQF